MNALSLVRRASALTARLGDAQKRTLAFSTAKKNAERELAATEAAQVLIQAVAQQTQDELSKQVSDVVTLALNAVFTDDYKFGIEYERKRGKTEARLYFEKNGRVTSPMAESGGGVVDVAGFALRIALWSLQRPRPAATIVLDEPFKFVSREMQARAGKMLKALSKDLGIQFLVVSHDPAIIGCADRTYSVRLKNRISVVEEVKEEDRE